MDNERSNLGNRSRENSEIIYNELRTVIEADILDLKNKGGVLEFRRGGSKAIKPEQINGFGTAIFAFEAATCRASLAGLAQIIGITERPSEPGTFDDNRWCRLLYKDFNDEDQSGIFQSETLYRVCYLVMDHWLYIH